jgi:pyruvate,water dikinase
MNADYSVMTLKQCGDTMEKMRDLINDLAYYRFKYALFSTFLLKSEPEKKLRKIDKKYTVYDLYKNLDNETSVMSRDVELLAFALSKDEAVKDAITGGMGYAALIEKYPDTKALFDKFLEKHGYKSDYNC